MKRIISLVVGLLVCLGFWGEGHATLINLTPTDAGTANDDDPVAAFERLSSNIEAASTGTTIHRALMEFDLSGIIGNVQTAVLSLRLASNTNPPNSVGLHGYVGDGTKRTEVIKIIGTDDAMAEIWIKAICDYESLKGVERMRASMLFHMAMRGAEQEFIHIGTGHADDPYLESVNLVLSRTLSFPGLRQWWKTTGSGYNQGFQDHANKLIAATEESRVSSDFDLQNES